MATAALAWHVVLFAQLLLKHNGQSWLCVGRSSPAAMPRPPSHPDLLPDQDYNAALCASISVSAPAVACRQVSTVQLWRMKDHTPMTHLITPQLTHGVSEGTDIGIGLIIAVVYSNQA